MELTLVLAESYRDFQIFMGQALAYWPSKTRPAVKKLQNGWQINDVEFRYATDERSLMGKRDCRYTETEKAHWHKEYWAMKERLKANNIKRVDSPWV